MTTTAYEGDAIAMRALALHCVAAVAFGVDRDAVVDWMHEQKIWNAASPAERAFLEDPDAATDAAREAFRWRKEAEWTLLWAAGLVGALGSPAKQCDTVALAIDIMPRLGSDIGPFLARAAVRADSALLVEDDRHDDLWCRALADRRAGTLPSDLNWNVLYQRRYAFEWLRGSDEWDTVRCDA
jgi:hypothetical protein